MNFKRQEGFRFVFNEAIDAKFKLRLNGRDINFESFECKIIDISPRGIKMFSEAKIGVYCIIKVQTSATNLYRV
ncbi:hypothetical protein [Lysinibacillus telephonicus]|uniref:hypothetical protein n=1 Tax=Lysinibacillus telephonicus TaxID=1714840 RepID=UPI003BA20E41